MSKKSTNAKILMIALASMHYENISKFNGNALTNKEREKEIIKQRRRQQFKK